MRDRTSHCAQWRALESKGEIRNELWIGRFAGGISPENCVLVVADPHSSRGPEDMADMVEKGIFHFCPPGTQRRRKQTAAIFLSHSTGALNIERRIPGWHRKIALWDALTLPLSALTWRCAHQARRHHGDHAAGRPAVRRGEGRVHEPAHRVRLQVWLRRPHHGHAGMSQTGATLMHLGLCAALCAALCSTLRYDVCNGLQLRTALSPPLCAVPHFAARCTVRTAARCDELRCALRTAARCDELRCALRCVLRCMACWHTAPCAARCAAHCAARCAALRGAR